MQSKTGALGRKLRAQAWGLVDLSSNLDKATLLTAYLWPNYCSSLIFSFSICYVGTTAPSFLKLS